MDGRPWKKSKKGRKDIEEVGEFMFKIPSRSPDFTPAKNVFNLATKLLNREAVEKKSH